MKSSRQQSITLRKRAEALFHANIDTMKEISAQDICELLHELNIYKIELELQNQELRSTQLALEKSRDKYFTLYEFSPIGYFRLTESGLILEVNLAGANLLGIEKRKLLKRGFLRFIVPIFQQSFFIHKKRALKTNAKQTVELELIKNDGTHFFAQIESISINKNANNNYQLLTSVVDITQRKLVQEELVMLVEKRTQDLKIINLTLQNEISKRCQAEKKIYEHQKELAHISRLNTIGEMVSGIAHELNQPLAAIMHYAGGCIERLQRKRLHKNILDAMQQVTVQAEKAGKIVNHLKDFSKKNISPKVFLDINEIIQETLEFIDYELRHSRIKVQLLLPKKAIFISAIKVQIEQVLINIIQNAIEAMCEIADSKLHRLIIKTYQDKNKLANIVISDNGQGIPSHHIKKIFDPFFTTKISGIGLGLSISQTIIQEHGGKISLLTDTKNGAHFVIKLPAAKNTHAQ